MKFRWGFVLPLAVAQLVSWGSLYYAFAVIAGPMAAEMGWSSPAINGALSAGLAATGFASFFAGRVIDAYGGRALMTAGSVAAALLLLAWSQVTELWQLYAVWIAMGATFSCVLYEPVFAVMARELKDDYRRGIITITLLGGLASTAFIPLTQFLVDISDWRQALVVLAAIQIPFGILVHWFVLGSTSGTVAVTKATVPAGQGAQGAGHASVLAARLELWGACLHVYRADLPHHPAAYRARVRPAHDHCGLYAGGAVSGHRPHCGFCP